MIKKTKEPKKETIMEFMNRFDCAFSMETESGFTNISFEKDYKDNVQMVVRFFDDEGHEMTDSGVPFKEVEKAADFIKGYKEMQLNDYSREVNN